MTKTKNDTPGRSLLLARFSAMGDIAMTIPVLYPLAQALPNTQFTMLTKPGMVKLFVSPPKNLTVIGVDLPGNPLGDAKALARAVDNTKPDTFVDLHDVLRTRLLSIICRLRGIKVYRFDKARKAKRLLVAKGAKNTNPVTGTIERYRQALLNALNANNITLPPFKGVTIPDNPDFGALPAPTATLRVGIAPFARHQAKEYPFNLTTQLITQLAQRNDTQIYLFGAGRNETDKLQKLVTDLNNPHNIIIVAGSGISFAAELALMSHMSVMLTMDSANMHLAALAGAPTISLWGATHPAAGFAAFNSTPDNMLQDNTLDCRPCSIFGNKSCPKTPPYNCFNNITPQHIIKKILALTQK